MAANGGDDEDGYGTIKMGRSMCRDELVVEAITNASIRASKVGYLASTYLRHEIYDAIINNRLVVIANLFPLTERSIIAPFWNEVGAIHFQRKIC